LNNQAVKERTDTTVKLAAVSGKTAAEVSEWMTAIWNNFDDGSQSLQSYADKLTALGAATASSADEIAGGLEKFAAVAETVGLSYDYAAAALATITAQTRQSEDVVGTSLKTIFARMESLKLGEVLEDGTTAGQYAAQMEKVGVSIKDASGQLKDMDVILDELGARWETLARDEQIALA
jgi:TP901 family phage tail tape measure protein